MTSTCTVCLETTNKSTRAESKCSYCATIICRTCLQTYLLNDISEIPRCVNVDCGHGWTRDWLDNQFTRSFRLVTYKEHREKLLGDREKARLPDTQEQAGYYKLAYTAREEADKELGDVLEKIHKLRVLERIAEIKQRNAQRTIDSHGLHPYPPPPPVPIAAGGAVAVEVKARVEFIKPCPAEGCRGFLSTAWKCGICYLWSCPDCHEVKGLDKDVEHTCDAGKVASARLIQRDTRPCPKCGVRISKIEGCDQMWCTACNTAFNWRTGTIATGPVHNPHYFEYLRRTGQAQGQEQANPILNCNQQADRTMVALLQSANTFVRGIRTNIILTPEQQSKKYLLEVYRLSTEYADPYGYHREPNPEETFRTLRVKYMAGKLSEEEWKTALQRAEKDVNFYHAKNDIRQLYVNASRDILRGLLQDGHDKEAIKLQAEKLIEYINETSAAIKVRFGRKMNPIVIRME